jgi:hypothetical protein
MVSFVSVKYAKQFATVFADMSVVISQNDKVKIELRISTVGQTFRTLQLIYKPVYMTNHGFPVGTEQKLILLVYLIINLNKLNDELQTGKLTVSVCRQ